MNVDVWCPYCGEENRIRVDEFGGRRQEYVEDCHVCCRPWQVRVVVHSAEDVDVELRSLDE